MQYHEVEFLGSAADRSQWPATDVPEILFCGRSNAGKSSLINALTNRKNAAWTGKTPGKTVLLNFFLIDHKVIYTDAPGYGYAKGGTKRAVDCGGLLEPYFQQREQLKALVLVLDIRRIPNDDDLTMIEAGKKAHLPVLAACTKADKVSKNEANNQLRRIAAETGIPISHLYPVSNTAKSGIEAFEKALLQAVTNKE